jgi:tripartite-type tricarboxylate transporter receptor subunit TctC
VAYGLASVALFTGTAGSLLAQSWPERNIQAIVPFAPGAANDIVGRIVFEQASKQINKPIVIENRPGAGGTIGVTAVAKAPADGHTLLIHSSSFSSALRSTRACPTIRSMTSRR